VKLIVKSLRKTSKGKVAEVDALTSQLEKDNADMAGAQTEMEQLKREADAIQNQTQPRAVEEPPQSKNFTFAQYYIPKRDTT
jgi:predicted  nucleic acid-binding Zn-ribbon protein